MNIKRITPGEEITFPCWLKIRDSARTVDDPTWWYLKSAPWFIGPLWRRDFTHYAPDGPMPTEAPEEGKPDENMSCFWPSGCSDSKRCREFGACVASAQNLRARLEREGCSEEVTNAAVTLAFPAQHAPQPVPSDVREAIKQAADEIGGVVCAGMLGAKTPAGTFEKIIESALAPHWQKMEERNQQLRETNTRLNTRISQSQGRNKNLEHARADLESELAKAKEDGERLDWLEQNGALLNSGCMYRKPTDAHVCITTSTAYPKDLMHFYGADYRAAIDAARSQQGESS